MTKISESGLIGSDGKLRLPMDRLNAEFARHPGKRVVVRFEIAERGSSELQQGYYYGYIIPTLVSAMFTQGTRISEQSIDRWLVEQYPGDKQYNGNTFVVGRQFTLEKMSDYLEWLKQFAAENYNVYIEDPKAL